METNRLGSIRLCTQKNASVSLVILTCKRENSLKKLLHSILGQSKLPKEVIVVDDGDDFRAQDLVERLEEIFSDKCIKLEYLRNIGQKGIPKVRNLGAMHAKEEILIFLDDDVTLDKRFIAEIWKVYETHPMAAGVKGVIANAPMPLDLSSKLRDVLNRFFFLNHLEKDKCRVLRSGYATQQYAGLSRIIKCEWFSGGNQSYKRKILETHKFDENMKRIARGEDLDFSYRIFRNYPNSLYISPFAKVFHDYSLPSSSPNDVLIYSRTLDHFYIFYKLMEQTFSNKFAFILSIIGQVVLDVALGLNTVCFSREKTKRLKLQCLYQIKCSIRSVLYSIKHLQEIKMGQLGFFDELLFANEQGPIWSARRNLSDDN